MDLYEQARRDLAAAYERLGSWGKVENETGVGRSLARQVVIEGRQSDTAVMQLYKNVEITRMEIIIMTDTNTQEILNKPTLTTADIAALEGVHPSTVRRWAQDGLITRTKHGRAWAFVNNDELMQQIKAAHRRNRN